VIAEYAWMAPVLQFLPKTVTRYVDCHDLLSERTMRFQAAGLDPWVICSERQELELLSHADVLIAIQHREQQLLQRLLPERKVVCLLPSIDLPRAFRPAPANGATVLAMGAKHAGNDGIREFAEAHWPRVMQSMPEARLHIVGRIGQVLNGTPGVNVIGNVQDVAAHYMTAAVVLCPVTVGTGIKMKMLEALRYGKAVVATPAAVEGVPSGNERAWITENSLAACAKSIVDVLTNSELRGRLERAAFMYGEQCLSHNSFLNQLRPILPGRARQLLAELAPAAWVRNGRASERIVCK
jgi:succinoglycan biosynthesis protein ExoO